MAAACCVFPGWISVAGAQTAREVMRQVEANQRISEEIVAFEMVLIDRTGFQRRRAVREFRHREPGGRDASIIFFEDPPDIRGSALLSKERPDGFDDQWLYLPAVGKIRRIAESGRTDYFLGTDLTFEDFSVEDIDRYTYVFVAPDTVIDGRIARVIDAVPADTAARRRSGYGRRRVYVDADRDVILRTEYFDRAGGWIKLMMSSDVKPYAAVWRSNRILVDNLVRRHRTDILVTDRRLPEASPAAGLLPADFFTPRTLQRGPQR